MTSWNYYNYLSPNFCFLHTFRALFAVVVYLNKHFRFIEILTFHSHLLTFTMFAKEFVSVSSVIHRESFLWFFFRHQDGMVSGGVWSSYLARRSGGIRSLPGCGWLVSNQSAASGTIRATWAGRENRTFLSFPVRAHFTCVKNVRVPGRRCVAPDRRRRIQDF